MADFEKSNNRSRNINTEWALLKEMADAGEWSFSGMEKLEANERKRHRRRGRMLLNIVKQMPDKPDMDTKNAKLDKIYQAAERGGLKGVIDETLEDRINTFLVSKRIGEASLQDSDSLSEKEQQRVERLREKVIDLTEIAPGAMAEDFPSKTYLYHGSTVPSIEKILQTGGLKNGVALLEDDPSISAIDVNSGFEGVSWSMNGIDALPGTRGHMAGFLAAPENLLGDDTCLVIPSRPAPYEVLQVSRGVDPKEFYAVKNQLETWGDGSFSLGERNNVDGNLQRMLTYEEGDIFMGESRVYDYDGDMSPDELRRYYTLDEQGNLIWDNDIYQKTEIPPALPWLQSLIDQGIFAKNDLKELDSVQKVIDHAKTDKDFIEKLISMEHEVADELNLLYEKMQERTKAIRLPIDKMFFVTSHRDLEDWLKVMARTGAEPKGILLYDDNQVVLENFASQYEGNHRELDQEIGAAMNVDRDFWKNEMRLDPENTPRSGDKGQVLLESAVKRDKIIQLNEDGELEIISVEGEN